MSVRTESNRTGGESSSASIVEASPFARAETLLQTVTGIAAARIVPHPSNSGGIAVIRVHCTDAASPGQIIRNVRSALFAGCGIAVSAECIDFVNADELDSGSQPVVSAQNTTPVSNATSSRATSSRVPSSSATSSRAAPPNATRTTAPRAANVSATAKMPIAEERPAALYTQAFTPSVPSPSSPEATPQRTIRIAQHGAANAPAASYDVSSAAAALDVTHAPGATGVPAADRVQRILRVVAAEEAAQPEELAVSTITAQAVTPDTKHAADAASQTIGGTVRELVASAAALRLESVEMRKQAGRLRCRVVISLGNDHFGAVADSNDLNAGEIPLAGRVACDALRAGGFTDARFDGAAVAQINGRQHVVVALSEWTSGATTILSGAAPLEELPERAAAIAAIKAVLAQDIN